MMNDLFLKTSALKVASKSPANQKLSAMLRFLITQGLVVYLHLKYCYYYKLLNKNSLLLLKESFRPSPVMNPPTVNA